MLKLIAECPEELKQTLQEIICWQCDDANGDGEQCDYRHQGTFCDVVEPAVELIHEAYWKYQVKEMANLSRITGGKA